jgi:nitrate reductase NapAB chaperone NapD
MDYICYRCGYETKDKGNFKKHLLRKTKCKLHLNDICIEEIYREYFGNDLSDLYNNEFNKLVINNDGICPFCNVKYSNIQNLKRHMKNNCKKNPLNNPNNNVKYEKVDGKLIVNINNIDNSTNIQNIQNIQTIHNIVFNFVNKDGTTSIMRENIKDFGMEAVEDLSNKIYQNAMKNCDEIPDICTIADKLHFNGDQKFHNIRMIKPYDDAKHHKIEDLGSVMYTHSPEIILREVGVDKGYIEDFEKMFTQILTKDGWKNVNIRDVVYLLFSFILLKIEGHLDDKVKTIQDKKYKENYENKLKSFNTIQFELRRLIKSYNTHGKILPRNLVSVKNIQNISQETGIPAKEVARTELDKMTHYVEYFNETIQKLIETIKEKSSILHGECGEKLIILNNKIDPENCTFESLVDGQYYERLCNNKLTNINEEKDSKDERLCNNKLTNINEEKASNDETFEDDNQTDVYEEKACNNETVEDDVIDDDIVVKIEEMI